MSCSTYHCQFSNRSSTCCPGTSLTAWFWKRAVISTTRHLQAGINWWDFFARQKCNLFTRRYRFYQSFNVRRWDSWKRVSAYSWPTFAGWQGYSCCFQKNQITFTILKGNSKIELINLRTSSRLNPMIRKGSSTSQSNGRIKISAMAIGQQMVNKIHQSKIAISVFMCLG